MNNSFRNSKIYMLVCDNPELIYFGSTIQDLETRFKQHAAKSNKSTSRQLFTDSDNVEIKLIEHVDCNNKKELETVERYYIENTQCCNIVVPGRTDLEYRQAHRQELAASSRDYYWNKRDKVLKRVSNYYKKNKKKINERKGAKNREKVICPNCIKTMSRCSYYKHKKKHYSQ
jgi:hypothetical protein